MWARHPRVWRRAVAIALAPAPDIPGVLIQRDFHPGNVLWKRGRVSGVVDWQATSIGPAVADVAHCRTNLLAYGPRTAERFTSQWEAATGMAFHPWADVVTVVGLLDDLREGWDSVRLAIETLLARAVAELGGVT